MAFMSADCSFNYNLTISISGNSCWYSQELVASLYQLHSCNIVLLPPTSPDISSWTFTDHIRSIYNNTQRDVIPKPVRSFRLLVEEYCLDPREPEFENAKKRKKLLEQQQNGELLLESLKDEPLFEPIIPKVIDWLEHDPCSSCGHKVNSRFGKDLDFKWPFVATECPEKSDNLASIFKKIQKTYGFIPCPRDGCNGEVGQNLTTVLKQASPGLTVVITRGIRRLQPDGTLKNVSI